MHLRLGLRSLCPDFGSDLRLVLDKAVSLVLGFSDFEEHGVRCVGIFGAPTSYQKRVGNELSAVCGLSLSSPTALRISDATHRRETSLAGFSRITASGVSLKRRLRSPGALGRLLALSCASRLRVVHSGRGVRARVQDAPRLLCFRLPFLHAHCSSRFVAKT